MKFEVSYADGYLWSATPAPSTTPAADLNALTGTQFRIRYRRRPFLRMKPDIPAAVARNKVESILNDLADERTARGIAPNM